MDTEIVVYLHSAVLRSYQKQLLYEILRKWMHLENIILNEITHTKKNRHNMQSPKIGY